MNKIFLVFITLCSLSASAQPRQVENAIIHTTTLITAPEEESVENIQNPGGRMNFRNFTDGETKSVTYLKGSQMKTVLKSEMGRSLIFRDEKAQKTTTCFEMMGNKMGFYITDEEQKNLAKQMDSARQARRSQDSSQRQRPEGNANDWPVDIIYTTATKDIAGYSCTRAWAITTRLLGIKDTVTLWYTPDIQIKNLSSTGGFSGFGNMINTNTKAFSQIEGFVMSYEMKMRRNRKMEVWVTKLELEPAIDEKEFSIPKEYDLKPMKEMQSMFGGGQPRRNF